MFSCYQSTWERVMPFLQKVKRFFADERGSNAIEYGLIASLIAVAIITAVTAVGTELTTLFETITGKL
jgi:pilus assembly protein Flp/PilA